MTKVQMSELLKLSVKDKIRVVQTSWDDIASEQSIDNLSSDHKRILEERLNKINSGSATFSTWADVQKKYSKVE